MRFRQTLLLSLVQLVAVNAALSWIFPGLDNRDDYKVNGIEENTTRVNDVIPKNDNLTSRYESNETRPDSEKNNIIEEATLWLNEMMMKMNQTDSNLSNRFKINVTNTPSFSCTTTEGKEGICVKPQFCGKDLPVKDSSTLFTYRESACHNLLQCCDLDQVKTIPKKTNTLPTGCGWTNPGGYRLRSSDSDATGFSDFADFPWMVALLNKSHGEAWSEGDYIGGGTLIHPSVVLTAAHKVDYLYPKDLKCRAGEWDRKAENEIFPHQDRNVRKIVTHEHFLRLRAHYDIALLFLETPFELQDVYHIGVACLALDMPAPGTLCYSMGWGSSFNDTNSVTLLKKIQLPIVDPDTCQRQLRNTRLSSSFLLHHTLCCAGGEAGKDTCVGDGGASLVCPIKSGTSLKRYAVYGIVAYGVGCGVKDVPGVYAKIPTMIDWVNREMQTEQLPTTSYFT